MIRRSPRAFTLMETMVAMTLASVIIASVVGAVVNINSTIMESKRRLESWSEAKVIGGYLAGWVQGAGGGALRPHDALLIENGSDDAAAPEGRGCGNLAGIPACGGSDRLTILMPDLSSSIQVIGRENGEGNNPNLEIDGDCAMPLLMEGEQVLFVGATGRAISVTLSVPGNTNDNHCKVQINHGQNHHLLPGDLSNLGFPASIFQVSSTLMFLDRTNHSLMLANDSGQQSVLADNVYDFQVAAGYDGLPEDGRITDNDNASDEYLYNHGDDPAMPGADGAFATVRDDQLRMMRISIIVGVASSVMGGNTVSLLDGPPRTHAGIYLEPSSTRVSMRNVNVFTQ